VDFLIKYIKEILAWLLGFIDWIGIEVTKIFLAAFAAIINAIPVPSWVSGASGAIAAIPPGVAYFTSTMHIGTGATIMVSAYTIRFLIRRIPIIG
jgi:hypothetical protein